MSRQLISFAIPVYNFGQFVGQTIESIVDGAEVLRPEDFEILVLDSGSTDDTPAVVALLMEQHKNVRYRRTEKRGGIDHDLNLAISLVGGRYVWLFSGDDMLIPGWDRYVQPLLRDTDIALVPTILCNIDMSERRANPIFNVCHDANTVTFTVRDNDGSVDAYFGRALNLDALFGFMSSVIVRSDFWRSLPERTDYYGSCWAHCARLIQGFRPGCSINYLPKCLIRKRGGNDSFMEKGFVARIGISVNGWQRIIDEFFHRPTTQAIAYALLRHDISIALFLYGKVTARGSVETVKLEEMARMLYVEKYPTVLSVIYYWVFRLSPFTSSAAPLVERVLPYLIRLRHRMKRVLS